ncbi:MULTISPECIES: SDR family oxidoreductase [unclassified Acidisoma]|jgi:short-subunit dehydrogenase|uniref:SDR family oxidoreductase n=1 Tax=unclassified Acidisoma TaxID=2634065 RepID=UPI00131D96BE|nr:MULTISPECIES: SDR family oxidoreductase [unclassified Acidisoma]
MGRIVVITGSSAGVGRATAFEFARRGDDVALLARNAERLEDLAAKLRAMGVRALAIPTDVADSEAVKQAADRVENELGPIDVWINAAMATIFGAVGTISAAEFRRATEVTYLGQVYGTVVALERMKTRDRGTIINVGSALAYRSVPLQSAYCGAKFAVRGFTDSLRSELLHDRSRIHLTMVHLPAVNTPQFDWAMNKTGHRAQPVPPIFQPEVAARAIAFAATCRRREVWVGFSSIKAIVGNMIAPGLLDHYLAHFGYSSQMAEERLPMNPPSNLFESVPGHATSHGRFDSQARPQSLEMATSRHRNAIAAGVIGLGLLSLARLLRRRSG